MPTRRPPDPRFRPGGRVHILQAAARQLGLIVRINSWIRRGLRISAVELRVADSSGDLESLQQARLCSTATMVPPRPIHWSGGEGGRGATAAIFTLFLDPSA